MDNTAMLETILKCNRCGTCQEVCPTYKVSGDEFAVARGRLRLLRMGLENNLDLNNEPDVENFINQCLLCKACEVNCPSGVPTAGLISELRENYTQSKGLPVAKKILYRGLFSHNHRLNPVRKLTRLYQKSGIRGILKVAGVMPGINNLIPEMPKYSVRERLPDLLKDLAHPKKRVAYFLGCSVNQFFSQVGEATINVLQANNYAVSVPEVLCCGAPHQSAGDKEEFTRLAKHNLEKLSGLEVDAIIVDCSTCGSMLLEYGELFKDDLKYWEMAERVKAKVVDISSFLLANGYDTNPEVSKQLKVTFHDPCHGVRGLKVKDDPRKILKELPGIEFVEMQEADMCCGGAGSYSIFHPKISRKVLERKLDNFRKTGASVLVTSCPACMMQLGFGFRNYGLNGEVKHLVEMLAQFSN
ncbi:MAG: (Fe-S)-binding protein [Peptococcaceae bacterium]